MLNRLHATLAPLAPIEGVSGPRTGPSGSIAIRFRPEATEAQRTAAQDALATFDWSQETHDAWRTANDRASAKAWLQGGSIEAKAFRALMILVRTQINALRAQAAMTPASYTRQQVIDALLANIDSE